MRYVVRAAGDVTGAKIEAYINRKYTQLSEH